MNTKEKERLIKELFNYWCGKLGLPIISIKKDNRRDSALYACSNGVSYNTKNIKYGDKVWIIGAVFHEIGHVLFHTPYETDDEEVSAEYIAESFSLSMITLHYPKIKKQTIKDRKYMLSIEKWHKKWPNHYKAFKKIKEYR